MKLNELKALATVSAKVEVRADELLRLIQDVSLKYSRDFIPERDAAQAYGVTKRTIRHRIRKGLLLSYKDGAEHMVECPKYHEQRMIQANNINLNNQSLC